MRVRSDVLDREIGPDIGRDQSRESQRDQQEAGNRRSGADRGQRPVMARHAPERHQGLHDGDAKRQGKREMADLDDHARLIW